MKTRTRTPSDDLILLATACVYPSPTLPGSGRPPPILSIPPLAAAAALGTVAWSGLASVAEAAAYAAAISAADVAPETRAILLEQSDKLAEIAQSRVDAVAEAERQRAERAAAAAAADLRRMRCSDPADRAWIGSVHGDGPLVADVVELVEDAVPEAARLGCITWLHRQLSAIGATVRLRDGQVLLPPTTTDADRRRGHAAQEILNQLTGAGVRRGSAAARAACRELAPPAAIRADHAPDVDASEWA